MTDKIIKDIKALLIIKDKKKFIINCIPYLSFFYVGNIFANHIGSYRGGDIIDKIFQAILELDKMSFIPSIRVTDLLAGISVAALVKLIIYTKHKNAKKFRKGKEYGSARWVA